MGNWGGLPDPRRRQRLEQDYSPTTRQIALLRAECQMLQDILLADKRELGLLIERFQTTWDLDGDEAEGDPFERSIAALIRYLEEMARVRTARALPADPVREVLDGPSVPTDRPIPLPGGKMDC